MSNLSGKRWVNAMNDIPFIALGARERKKYDKDGKATDIIEAVRLTAISQETGEISIDLCPYSAEKLERIQKCFSESFTIDDLVGIENCKIFCYKNALRITITAADLRLVSDPRGEMIEL